MTTFWIIFVCFLISMIFLEPFGQLIIKRKEEIMAIDCYQLQYHNEDNMTKLYMIQDEDDNIFTSEIDIPLYSTIEVTYKGFNIPRLSIFPRIVDFKIKSNI